MYNTKTKASCILRQALFGKSIADEFDCMRRIDEKSFEFAIEPFKMEAYDCLGL
jgi:hypothetical protein